jgi:hypothetical protein
VITIKELHVVFDADADGDEAVFARLFAHHMARHEAQRRRSAQDARQAADDVALGPRRTS